MSYLNNRSRAACYLCCPKTAPITKSEVSHMISKGLDQSEGEMIGAEISSNFNFSHALLHLLSKMKGTSLAKRFVRGLAILLKSLMNLR